MVTAPPTEPGMPWANSRPVRLLSMAKLESRERRTPLPAVMTLSRHSRVFSPSTALRMKPS